MQRLGWISNTSLAFASAPCHSGGSAEVDLQTSVVLECLTECPCTLCTYIVVPQLQSCEDAVNFQSLRKPLGSTVTDAIITEVKRREGAKRTFEHLRDCSGALATNVVHPQIQSLH